MKKLILVLSVLFIGIGLQLAQAADQINHNASWYNDADQDISPDSAWSFDEIGTINDAWQATQDMGKHAAIVGWNVVKIPLIPLKHLVLQFVDLFCEAKNIVKHTGLAGFSVFRLGTDIVAAPFVYGYKYPKQTAVTVAALVAAGAVYEGSFLIQDLGLVDLGFIFEASGQVA